MTEKFGCWLPGRRGKRCGARRGDTALHLRVCWRCFASTGGRFTRMASPKK